MFRLLLSKRWIKREVAVLLGLFAAAALSAVVSAETGTLAPPTSAGPDGSPIHTGVVMVSATRMMPNNQFVVTALVNCPAGLTALGGGAKLIDANGIETAGGGMLTNSHPIGNIPVGWLASAQTGIQNSNLMAGITVYAICARIP